MKGKRLSAMAMAAMLGVLLVPSSAYAANADWTAGNPLIAHALGEYDGKSKPTPRKPLFPLGKTATASWRRILFIHLMGR